LIVLHMSVATTVTPATMDQNGFQAGEGQHSSRRGSMWGTVKTFTRQRKIQLILGVVIFLMMIIAGLLLVAGLQATNSGSVPSVGPFESDDDIFGGEDSGSSDVDGDVDGPTVAPGTTSGPTGPRRDELFDFLEDVSSPSVRDPLTPAGKAAHWLIDEDMRELVAADTSLLQRFGLATLYFATGGGTDDDGGWEDCSAIPEINYSSETLTTTGDALCVFRSGKYLCAEAVSSEDCTYIDEGTQTEVSTKRMLSPVSECDWYGIGCDAKGNVVSVVVDDNNLVGTLPSELATVEKLEFLSLRDNDMEGTLPPDWKDLTDLQEILLSDNVLNGTIPVEWKSLGKLKRLELQDNGMTVVPLNPELLKGVTSLKRLLLEANEVTVLGDIPTEIGLLESLENLSLDYVQVTGTLPSEIGLCKNLTHLSIADADMEGTIPSEIGQLEHLTMLSLLGSRFEGSIPDVLYEMDTLNFIKLERNRLTGTLSPSIGNLADLRLLILSQNRLTGSVPRELGSLVKMTSLILFHNEFTGAVPEEYCTGEIPDIGTLKADCLSKSIYDLSPAVECECCSVCCRNGEPRLCSSGGS